MRIQGEGGSSMAFRVRQPDEQAITSTKGFAASVSSQLPSLSLVILLLMH
jgi:hypothetical protein